jgi:hypothetical protein
MVILQLGWAWGLQLLTIKNKLVIKCPKEPWTGTNSDMRLGMWNMRSLYKASSLITVLKELSKYKLYLLWCKRSDVEGVAPNQQVNIYFYKKMRMRIIIRYRFFGYIRESVRSVEFVSNRMLSIILRDCWCDIIFLNIHVATDDKIDDVKYIFTEELKRVLNKYPKYYMNIFLGDFNAKVGKENIFWD